MAIVKMKHLRLVAMTSDREELLRLLQHMGCVEISEPSADPADPVWAGLTHPDSSGLAAAREEQSGAQRALEVLKQYAPAKGGLLQPKPGVQAGEFFDEELAQSARSAAAEINEMDRRVHAILAEENKLAAQKALLAPWLSLDLPLETQSTAQVEIQLGTLPAAVPMAQAEGELQTVGELVQLTEVSSNREFHFCVVMCHSSQAETALDVLKSLGWARVNLRDWTGTAAENTAQLEQKCSALAEEQAELKKKLSGMGSVRPAIQKLFDLAGVNMRREESRSRLLDTSQTFYLEGWVPAERWPQLEKALEPYPCAHEVSDPTEEEYPEVPVKLKNNWFTRPMNMVTEMYSLPAYGSLDPNPLMAPFFILFYGMMMADMGYGILMMLAGLIVVKKAKPKGTMDHMFRMVGLCGVTTFLFGAVTGGFFGDLIPQLLKVLNPESTFVMPALFTPVDNTLQILIGALALGVVQIFTGMAISFYKKLRDGQALDALFEEVTWWAILIGLVLAILGVTPLLLIAGGVLLLAGCVRTGIQKGGGPGKIIVSSLIALGGSLYNNITGYFQDILSYSRLMALMLSGAVVAQVFNTLGSIPGNVVILLIISMIGNLLNFALNLLGCYVHDMRLQCLEYFNRFYQDGGKPFRPLDYDTKYVEVQK